MLISAEGLDRAGTTATLDALGRWLERRGRRVEMITGGPSATVRGAAASRRKRPFLDARVAALLSAAELAHAMAPALRAGLRRGSVVLADRYAWTAIARGVARGLEPRWVRRLYAFLPRPDLTMYLRLPASEALHETLAAVPSDGALAAAAGAFGPFLERVVAELDGLSASAESPVAEPWPTARVALPARRPDRAAAAVRDAVKPWLNAKPSAGNGVARRAGAQRDAFRPPLADAAGHGEPGRLIVLEGIDHAGRSTHAGLLERNLRYAGRGVVRTSFGGSSIAGEALREAKRERGWDATAMVLLYAADLAERLEHVIRPALRAGLTVVADRYAYTPIARAVARGVPGDWVENVFAFSPRPDLVLWLDVPASVAIARGRGRAETDVVPTLDESRADDYRDFQVAVAGWFAAAESRLDLDRVDASRDPNLVQASIRRAVTTNLDTPTRRAVGQ